jgi:hypothetical protein
MKALDTCLVEVGEPAYSDDGLRKRDFDLGGLVNYLGNCGSNPVNAQTITPSEPGRAILYHKFAAIPAK